MKPLLAKLLATISPLWLHFNLIKQLTKRNIAARYKGSVLGGLWVFITPLLMLTVYTFVFSVVFKLKWNSEVDTSLGFGIVLFSGMIVHGLFTEVMVTSTNSIIHNAQYVKKVVFPLEILAWTSLFSAVFQALLGFFILFVFIVFSGGALPFTLLWLPIALLPLMIMALGTAWWLSATTVYIRDIAQLVGIASTVMLFVSPVFYPVSRLPDMWQSLIYLNPISSSVEQVRRVLLQQQAPDWSAWFIYMLVAIVFAVFGLAWFQRLRKGFADVL